MSTPLVHLLLLKAFGSNHTHVYAWPSRFFPHFCLFFKCVHLSKVMLQSVLCLEYHWSTHKKQVKMLCVELDCENKTSAAQCFYLTSISVLIKHNYQKKRIKSWSTFLFNCFYFFFFLSASSNRCVIHLNSFPFWQFAQRTMKRTHCDRRPNAFHPEHLLWFSPVHLKF